MSHNKKFPTLFKNDNYLIFRDTEIVTLVSHNHRASLAFGYEEWRGFAKAIVSAANKDCENEKEADEQTCSVSDTIHRLVENAIKPLQDRIEELEREWNEPSECEASNDVINIVNTVQKCEDVAVPKVILADEGTLMGDFQKERIDAISEMFDNQDENGIYPTTRLFARLDAAVGKATKRVRKECEKGDKS